MLADVQSSVHSPAAKDDGAAGGSASEPKILSAISSHADYFMENYLLVKVRKGTDEADFYSGYVDRSNFCDQSPRLSLI